MSDRYRIDSHKLMYHIKRVASWLDGEKIYPIYMEISPSGTCNHRCSFCSVDFMGFKKNFLDAPVLIERISELSSLGIKSIMFAGEGEPFLHKDMSKIIVHTKNSGIDVGITTNGVLMRPGISDAILDSVEWIKISLNAGTPETYSKIHGTSAEDFNKVVSNMEYAVKRRSRQKSKCVLGLQILLIPENSHEVITLARRAKDMGVDYLVVKPYTHHHLNKHKYEVMYKKYEALEQELLQLNTESFHTIFRARAMEKWDHKKREYQKCLALPFWSYIDSLGNVWGCSAHLLDDRFNYGSIYKNTFKEIWEGRKRAENLALMSTSFDIGSCKMNCRMDEVNRYLDELKHLPDHVNFI